jgi:hypothetical protein
MTLIVSGLIMHQELLSVFSAEYFPLVLKNNVGVYAELVRAHIEFHL